MRVLPIGVSIYAAAAFGLMSIAVSRAQNVIDLEPNANAQTGVAAPPSVGNGVANGVVKPAGAPSVGDGRANGVVKAPGSPSVGDGVANGVVKSTTVNQ